MAQTIEQHRPPGQPGASPLLHTLSPTSTSFMTVLISLAQDVAICNGPKVCQRRNTAVIKRRVKVLSVLFEEVRDLEITLPPSAILCFTKIQATMRDIKFLLDECTESSRIWLLVEHEAYSTRFQQLSQDIAVALDDLPLELLDVSDEVTEQVKLTHLQARKSKILIDPKEEQLRLDVFSVMREFARKATPDPAKLKIISEVLHLNNASDCHRELRLLEQEIERQTNGQGISRITSLISFVRYCKCILYGVEIVETSSSTPLRNDDWEETDQVTAVIPEDFTCPISLDLMRDPVILASGQTYDRASITTWIEDGNLTCPKTGLKLIHTTLTPNYALRSLISQWCKDHNVPFETTKKSNKSAAVDSMVSTRAALEATRMTVTFLVGKLSAGSLDVQRQVAYELRLLAKCGKDNRMCIGEAGAIPYLIPLLSSEDPKVQENAVTALLNLSIYEGNKSLIMDAGALDPIVKVLTSGLNMDARENAAATLFSLSVEDEYKAIIGSKPEAISGLVQLLSDGSPSGKRDAVTALFNICLYETNRPKVVNAGAVPYLVKFLYFDLIPLAEDALAVLTVLAGSTEGLAAISQSAAIPILVRFLRSGSARSKEKSLCVLLGLCRYGGDKTVDTVFKVPSALASLNALINTGTPRARHKAACLLRILHKSDLLRQLQHLS